jgi:hypothetical protein
MLAAICSPLNLLVPVFAQAGLNARKDGTQQQSLVDLILVKSPYPN